MRPARVMMDRVGSWSSRHQITSVTSPKVQIMAMPDPFSGSASGWATIGTSTPKSGVCTVVPNTGGVALVVGVRHQRHAGGHQLGPGRVDLNVVEAQAVVGAGSLPVLHLGLRHGRLVVDVPQRRGLGGVRLTPGQVAEEHALAGPAAAVVNGGVAPGPVHREADPAPQGFERLFILRRELVAQGDEVWAADRDVLLAGLLGRLEVGVEGQRGIAAHPEVGLYPALGGQPVVVPSHRVEELPAAHAPVAGQGVGLHVAEDRAHVQRAGHRRRRGVDGEDLFPCGLGVEAVRPLLVPHGGPGRLHPVECGLVGNVGRACRVGRHDRVTVPGCCTSTTPLPVRSARSSPARPGRCRCTSAVRRWTTFPTSVTGGST